MEEKLESICEELKEYDSSIKRRTEIENRVKYINKILAEFGKLMEYHDKNYKEILSELHK